MTIATSLSGSSEIARYIAEKVSQSIRYLKTSHALGTPCVLDELNEVWNECHNSNWDGYNALPVTDDAYQDTRRFIEALPSGFACPTVAADPHGDFSLEWYRRRRRVLSLGFAGDGYLHYAALLGPNKMSGTEAFFGEIPKPIIDLVRRVYE